MFAAIQNQWMRLPKWGRLLLILLAVIFAPPVLTSLERITGWALLTQVNRALIYVCLALGLNIVVGFAGLLDLGYAAFFAIGAYAFGVLTWPNLHIEASFFIALWICAAVAAVFGMLIGAPTLRLRGDYLAIVTLAFGEIIPKLVRNFDDITINIFGWKPIERFNLTNGPLGMNPLGQPNFGFIEELFDLPARSLAPGVNPNFWFFVIVILLIFVLFASRRLEFSRVGRAWKAIREDETAAEFMGVNLVRAKLLAFALGASFSGLAGAIFASMLSAIVPDMFQFQVSIFLLIIVILSGIGSVWGVLLGGLLISIFDGVFLAQILPSLLPGRDIQNLRWVFFGFGLVAFMILRPQGLFGAATKRRGEAPPLVVEERGAA